MNHFLAGVIVGGFVAGLPILLMVYYLKKFLDMFEQDLHDALELVGVPASGDHPVQLHESELLFTLLNRALRPPNSNLQWHNLFGADLRYRQLVERSTATTAPVIRNSPMFWGTKRVTNRRRIRGRWARG
jgi:hypothetical protein